MIGQWRRRRSSAVWAVSCPRPSKLSPRAQNRQCPIGRAIRPRVRVHVHPNANNSKYTKTIRSNTNKKVHYQISTFYEFFRVHFSSHFHCLALKRFWPRAKCDTQMAMWVARNFFWRPRASARFLLWPRMHPSGVPQVGRLPFEEECVQRAARRASSHDAVSFAMLEQSWPASVRAGARFLRFLVLAYGVVGNDEEPLEDQAIRLASS